MLAYLRARIESLGHATRGIGFLMRSESHARIHLLATIMMIVAGLTLSISAADWCSVIMAAGLVWTAEAVNTALERIVDLSSPDKNAIAGEAKDLAAGAVLLAAITAAAVGLIVFIPRIDAIL